jgi:hypothetical protein
MTLIPISSGFHLCNEVKVMSRSRSWGWISPFYIWGALSERFLNIFRGKPSQWGPIKLFYVLHPEIFLIFPKERGHNLNGVIYIFSYNAVSLSPIILIFSTRGTNGVWATFLIERSFQHFN